MRLSVPVALPARTAAVFLIICSIDGPGGGGPAVEVLDRCCCFLLCRGNFEERRTASGHLPALAEFFGEFFDFRLDVLGGPAQLVWRCTFHFVPCTVHIGGLELDAGPGDGEPSVAWG